MNGDRALNRPLVFITSLLCVAGTQAQTATTAPPAVTTTTNPAYLAANCANCHGSKGASIGAMPSLAGLKKDYIIEQMKAFREGKRQATIMHQLSKGYTDEQIALIADFFSKQTAAK
jgi:cytochrome subunit of sulfide dehydrogenase